MFTAINSYKSLNIGKYKCYILIFCQVCEKEREKFLTAKYGTHQMALIRKRLKVEMWMYDHLQKLFSSEVGVTCHLLLASYVSCVLLDNCL